PDRSRWRQKAPPPLNSWNADSARNIPVALYGQKEWSLFSRSLITCPYFYNSYFDLKLSQLIHFIKNKSATFLVLLKNRYIPIEKLLQIKNRMRWEFYPGLFLV